MAEFISGGIRYVSDSNGYFRYKGYNYLKYNPGNNTVITTSGVVLTKNVSYYVN
jgi:hypothetical protein